MSGPRVITPKTKEEMKKILGEIRSGAFAKAWIAEDKAGRANFKRMKDAYANHPIEKVGAVLRAMMPWLKKKGMDRNAPAAKKARRRAVIRRECESSAKAGLSSLDV